MPLPLRETGSVVLPASREQVLGFLAREARAPGAARVESGGFSYVLRDAPGGTRLVLARRADVPVTAGAGARRRLRESVEAEIARLRDALG